MSRGASAADRRTAPRVSFLRPVQVREEDGAGARRLFATNLSHGGMFIRTPRPPPAGSQVRLSLPLQYGEVPFAVAQVTHAVTLADAGEHGQLPGFGVRFLELTPPALALIHQLTVAPVGPLTPSPVTPPPVQIPGLGLLETCPSTPAARRPSAPAAMWALALLSLGLLGLGIRHVWIVRATPMAQLRSTPAPVESPLPDRPFVPVPALLRGPAPLTQPLAPAKQVPAAGKSRTTGRSPVRKPHASQRATAAIAPAGRKHGTRSSGASTTRRDPRHPGLPLGES